MTGKLFVSTVVVSALIMQHAIGTGVGELQQAIEQFGKSPNPDDNMFKLKMPYFGSIRRKVLVGVAPKILGKVSADGSWRLEFSHVRIKDGELLLCNESKGYSVLRETAKYRASIPSLDELADVKSNADIERLIGGHDHRSSFFSTTGEATIENLASRWVKWSAEENGEVNYLFVTTIVTSESEVFKAYSVQYGILKPLKSDPEKIKGVEGEKIKGVRGDQRGQA